MLLVLLDSPDVRGCTGYENIFSKSEMAVVQFHLERNDFKLYPLAECSHGCGGVICQTEHASCPIREHVETETVLGRSEILLAS